MPKPQESEPGAPECWDCRNPVPTYVVEREAVLHAQSAEEGGPYHWIPCPTCRTRNAVLSTPAGAHELIPADGRDEAKLVDRIAPRFGREYLARARTWWLRHGSRIAEFEQQGGGRHRGIRPRQATRPTPEPPPRRKPAPPPRPGKSPPPPPPPRPPAAAPPRNTPDPWAVLGVPKDADPNQVKRAYRTALKRCHPDRVANLDEEFQALAHRKSKELREAYEAIKSGR